MEEEGGVGEVSPENPSNTGVEDTTEVIQEVTSETIQETSIESATSESSHIETTQQTSVPLHDTSMPLQDTSMPLQDTSAEEVAITQQKESDSVQQQAQESQISQDVQQENIKNQLNDINKTLENQQPVEFDNTVQESDWHTWRPRGKYSIPKLEIKFGDLHSEAMPDIPLKEVSKPVPVQEQKEEVVAEPIEMIDQYAPRPAPVMMNGDLNSPSFDIPLGIPLLARVLPKEEGDGPRESIPLERLFTPATDSGDITPRKKKVFSSSAFYAPNHPTVEDQVSLAQRISCSLIDENNKMSRGQTMYTQRKKRSVKWIHQAPGDGDEFDQSPVVDRKERPALKVQTTISTEQQSHTQHLQQLTVAGQPMYSPDAMLKQEFQNPPTGKGVELFAKRKKRSDQFIVDETTVQKSSSSMHHQEQESSMTSQSCTESFSQSAMSSSQVSQQESSISSGSQYLRSTCTAVQPTVDSSLHGMGKGSRGERKNIRNPSRTEGAPIYTAEVKVVQKASLPSSRSFEIPEDMPHHSIIQEYESSSKEEKRRSFNFAAKGWGTYNTFYTPVTFTATT